MGLAAAYVTQAIPQLPHLYATQAITHYEGEPAAADDIATADVHAIRITRNIVQYRDGEQVDAPLKEASAETPKLDQGLRTWGVFGPILSLAILDAAQNKLSWERWERGALDSPVAVFRFSVPRERSHYQVSYCCTLSDYGLEGQLFEQMTGYHGEMAIDPASRRHCAPGHSSPTLSAPTPFPVPISRWNMGRSCWAEWNTTARCAASPSPLRRRYGTSPMPTAQSGAPWGRRACCSTTPNSTTIIFSAPRPAYLLQAKSATGRRARCYAALTGADRRRRPESAGGRNSDGCARGQAGRAAAVSAADVPEITAAVATGLPDQPLQEQAQTPQPEPAGFRLRINARLVDVNVVALDKKGHPITGLKRGRL